MLPAYTRHDVLLSRMFQGSTGSDRRASTLMRQMTFRSVDADLTYDPVWVLIHRSLHAVTRVATVGLQPWHTRGTMHLMISKVGILLQS
jgi:hypothetical protein